jgi:hypothetical protein
VTAGADRDATIDLQDFARTTSVGTTVIIMLMARIS